MARREAVATLRRFVPGVTVEFAAKEDLREQLLSDRAPRRRATGMRVLTGTIDRPGGLDDVRATQQWRLEDVARNGVFGRSTLRC